MTRRACPRHEKIIYVIARAKILCPALILLFFFYPAPSAHALFGSKTKADEQAGAVLFRDKGCAYCHGPGGIGGKKAPVLTGLRKDKLWPPAKITAQILNGGQKMPPFGDSLTDQQIAQLVAYLRAKNRPIPPPAPTPPPAPPAQ
jgi:mono/diheme cytochrome c family protein